MKTSKLAATVADIVNLIETSGLPGMRPNDLRRLRHVSGTIEAAPFPQDLSMRFHTAEHNYEVSLMVRFEFEGDEFSVKCEFSWVTSSFDLVKGMEITSLQLAVLRLGARIEQYN